MAWRVAQPVISGSIVDVYANWLLGAGRADFKLPGRAAEQRVPLLITSTGATFRDRAATERFLGPDLTERLGMFLDPRNSSESLKRRGELAHETVFLLFPELEEKLISFNTPFFRNVLGFQRLTLGPPLRRVSVSGTTRDDPSPHVPSPDCVPPEGVVVVGVVDDGIPFAHERFRNAAGGTRVESVWVQDGAYAGAAYPSYGREIGKAEIEALFAPCTDAGSIDEDRLYRLADVTNFRRRGRNAVAWRASHGAHVMDLAAGFDPGAAPDWPIVAVQLPARTTEDLSGSTLTTYAVGAIKYIVWKAGEIAKARGCDCLPIVVNFSYGFLAGPHDGTFVLEAAIDGIVAAHNAVPGNAPLRVVIPSGNSRLGRIHADIAFPNLGSSQDLSWQVLPDDRTPSFVEIWLPEGPTFPDRIQLMIETPGGTTSPPLNEDPTKALHWLDSAGEVVCEATYHEVAAPTGRSMFLVKLQPTARVDLRAANPPKLPVAPSGVWRLTLKNLLLSPSKRVHAWVQRDDAPPGYPVRGRQSFFANDCYQSYDKGGRPIEEDDPGCVIKRDGSINAIATGQQPVVIGGLLRRELRAARYSAGGPVTKPVGPPPPHPRLGPDAVTVSDDSVVHAGVLAAGTRSGSVVAMDGTSVAAPQIARWIAGQLAAGLPSDRKAVENLAKAQEPGLPMLPQPPPNSRYGAGRIVLPPVVKLPRYET